MPPYPLWNGLGGRLISFWLGPAVVAALHAPKGVYNVGAAPVLRGELVDGYAKAAGVDSAAFLGPVLRRLAGSRIEPLTRSLRISSDHFSAQTGWQPVAFAVPTAMSRARIVARPGPAS